MVFMVFLLVLRKCESIKKYDVVKLLGRVVKLLAFVVKVFATFSLKYAITR